MLAGVCKRDTLKTGVSTYVLAATQLPGTAAAGPLDLIAEFGLDPQASVLAGVMAGGALFAAAAGGMLLRAARRGDIA